MSRSFAQASLLATTLGLAALGSSLTPAAALTSMQRLPSAHATYPGGAKTGPSASTHPISEKIHLPQVVTAPGVSKYPGAKKIHVVSGVENAPGASIYPGGAKTVPGVQTLPGASIYPGQSKVPLPTPGKIGGGVDNICPFNKFKCPPQGSAGTGPAGNPPQGSGPKPGGPIYPPGGTGPVVVVAPPAVYQAPVPVYQAPTPIVTATNATPAPVYQAPRPNVSTTNTATATTAPCNCLTKQYLDDGSVLFQDICTKEAAMATPDQLRAQVPTVAPTVR